MDPEVTVYLEDVHGVLLAELARAEHSIVAADACFTDREILAVLRRRAGHGVSIQVAITEDEINRPSKMPSYDSLIELGGAVHRVASGSHNASLMHHKFYVIDEQSVITGSYNGPHRALGNHENATVVRNHPTYAASFLETFGRIVGRQQSDAPAFNERTVRKRLEMVRNLIQLGEIEDTEPHLQKLRLLKDPAGLNPMIRAMEGGRYEQALEHIESWLSRASALVDADDAQIPYLRLRLQALELGLEALTSELADFERQLVVFHRWHDDALGDWIEAVLKARAELAQLQAQQAQAQARTKEESADAEDEAERAEQQYREYADEHERLQESPVPEQLGEESEAELKRLYRQTSQKCHPDKVDEEFKGQAVELFQALQNAYQAQDLDAVREIHKTVMSGGLSLTARSSTLSRTDRLHAAIAQMEHQIGAVVRELRSLKQSTAVSLMEQVKESAEDWEGYVRRRQGELAAELTSINEQIRAHRSSDFF